MKKKVRTIADGVQGIDQTVQNIWRLVNRDAKDPIIKNKARELKGNTELETVKNIYKYTWKTHKYRPDPDGIEHFTAPKYLVNKEFTKHLDCDDLVGILAALLLASGVPVRFKTIQWRRNDFTHIVLDFYHQGNWIVLDPVKKADGFGNQITEAINGATFKQKIYDNPMGKLITLEDGCCGGGRPSRAGNNAVNNNYIMIGNKADIDERGQAGQPEPQIVQVPGPERTKYLKSPYPVYKKIVLPVRTVNNPNITNYREFY